MIDLRTFKFTYSSLDTYERCPRKFYHQYMVGEGKLRTSTIETHLGTVVHESLRALYLSIQDGRTMSLKQLVDAYHGLWEAFKKEGEVIQHLDIPESEFNAIGADMLRLYYIGNEPFDQDETIAVPEKRLDMVTRGGNRIYGKIDRIARTSDKIIIIDYKTGKSSGFFQTTVDEHRQLAIYHLLAVKNKDVYNIDREIEVRICLLKIGENLSSTHSDEDLDKLEDDIDKLIGRIKRDETYPMNVTNLCGYCAYQGKCQEFNPDSA